MSFFSLFTFQLLTDNRKKIYPQKLKLYKSTVHKMVFNTWSLQRACAELIFFRRDARLWLEECSPVLFVSHSQHGLHGMRAYSSKILYTMGNTNYSCCMYAIAWYAGIKIATKQRDKTWRSANMIFAISGAQVYHTLHNLFMKENKYIHTFMIICDQLF